MKLKNDFTIYDLGIGCYILILDFLICVQVDFISVELSRCTARYHLLLLSIG